MSARLFNSRNSGEKTAILVADDQPGIAESLSRLLQTEGHSVEAAQTPRKLLERVRSDAYGLLLLDANFRENDGAGQRGQTILAEVLRLNPSLPVVAMSALATIDLAVELMSGGARDFISKPWDNARLLRSIRTHLGSPRLQRGAPERNGVAAPVQPAPVLIAIAPVMRKVLELIAAAGPSNANVLITGESGTGKDVVARVVHAASLRAHGLFVAVNVGGLAAGVFDSELFGHIKGAFTDATADRVGRFAMADGGTLFLDEIATIPLPLQAKLLRVLETGEIEAVGSSRGRRVDVRLISATNAILREEVRKGNFRQDLMFRLNTIEIRLPALRTRKEDIEPLANYFLAMHAERYGRPLYPFEESAIEALLEYSWPGNVRELNHVVERAVITARTESIRRDDLALDEAEAGDPFRLEDMSLDSVESVLIDKALDKFGGNISRAAEALGLSRSSVYRRLQRSRSRAPGPLP